jgi:transcriptional regulator with XRE-family HTH domain
MEDIHFPNQLKKYRAIHGLTQTQVAYVLGFSNVTRIGQWEQGHAIPGFVNLLKLSILYDAHLPELYSDIFQELKSDIQQRRGELFLMV